MNAVIIAAAILIGAVIIGFFLRGKKTGTEENNSADEIKSLTEEKSRLSAQNELLNKDINNKTDEISTLREEKTNHLTELSRLETVNKNLLEKLENQKQEIADTQAKFSDAFKNLANEILEEKTQKFTEQNRSNLDELLNPLKEKIKDFESKVTQTDEKNRISHATLVEQIRSLKDLNKQISDDANNLTKALKGEVKIQGNWGEVILERLLEESGLRKGIEYDTQVSMTDDTGHRLQPDVIIKLPENKHIIVDSKVSLVNYERLVSATTEEQTQGYLRALNLSMKAHIDELHKKHYQNLKGLNTPDFVMLFIPIEGVFTVVMQQDSTVYQYAYNKQIVIVSPTTLMATLRTIAFIWQQENQTVNAKEIARQSGALYDKFVSFLDSLEEIDKGLKKAESAYDEAKKKLSTGKDNLVRKVEKLRELGAKTNKSIPKNYAEETDNLIDFKQE